MMIIKYIKNSEDDIPKLDELNAVADEIINFLISEYKDDHGVHAQTLLAAASAITGDVLLRTAEDLSTIEDSWISSDTVNSFIINDDPNILTISMMLNKIADIAGATPLSNDSIYKIIKHTSENIGASPYPPLTVSNNEYPLEWSPNAAVRYREPILSILKKADQDDGSYWMYCAHSVGQLILQTKEVLDPNVSLRLCLEILIGVSKMNIKEEVK